MVSHLFFYQLVLVALVWLCVMLQWVWPSDPATVCPTTPEPPGPRPKRHHKPTPFAGLTKKPRCDACEHASAPHSEAPRTPPPRIVPARGRRRQVDTSTHFCPNPDCIYRGSRTCALRIMSWALSQSGCVACLSRRSVLA
jgi:hypothetical protein